MTARPLTVLVVDDEPVVCNRLAKALTLAGYQVETCQEGRIALEHLETRRFDIVVSDVRIDAVSGLEVLAAAQRHAPRTQTILITGYATLETAREALAKGAFEFIAKPFKPKDLLAVIGRAAAALAREPG